MRRALVFYVLFFVFVASHEDAYAQHDSLRAINLESFNSDGNDAFPLLSAHDSILYFTRQDLDGLGSAYVAARSDSGNWSTPVEARELRVFGRFGSLTMDTLENTYFACKFKSSVTNIGIVHLHAGVVKELGVTVNSTSWQSHPCVTLDGQTLYFAQMPWLSKGRVQIVVCHHLKDESWTQPATLGLKINYPTFVCGPFIWRDNTTLFFSANFEGKGLNMYVTHKIGKNDDEWSAPHKLPYPINVEGSSTLSCALSSDEHEFYFASNRPGGKGKFDLYEVHLPHGLADLTGEKK